MTNKTKQNDRIIEYMKKYGSITQLDALNDLGVMRLASRISDIKKQGYPIVSETVTVMNRYGEKCRVKKYALTGGTR